MTKLTKKEAAVILAGVLTAFFVMLFFMLGCASVPRELSGYAKFRADKCFLCESTEKVEWCHQYPQSMAKGIELEYLINAETNGCSLCRRCHECIGHYYNTRKYYNAELLNTVKKMKADKTEYRK